MATREGGGGSLRFISYPGGLGTGGLAYPGGGIPGKGGVRYRRDMAETQGGLVYSGGQLPWGVDYLWWVRYLGGRVLEVFLTPGYQVPR